MRSYIKLNRIAYWDIHDLDMARPDDKRNFRQLIRILMKCNIVSDIKTFSGRDYLVIDQPKIVACPTYQEFILNDIESQKPCKYTEEVEIEDQTNIVFVDFSKKRRIS